LEALNRRGEQMLRPIAAAVAALPVVTITSRSPSLVELTVAEPEGILTEEERSRAPSVFTVLRAITDLFRTDNDSNLGLYGAFGYDLAFQFDPVKLHLDRPASQRDVVLYIPDEILVVDHYNVSAWRDRYEFAGEGFSTEGIAREITEEPF